jgi:hypothetical protein
MNIPFTTEQFLAVFARYNVAVWPAQVFLYALALGGIVAARRGAGRWVWVLLAGLWAWMGLVYHWGFFASINPAAWVFGAFFLIQAALLLTVGVCRAPLAFSIRPDRFGVVGAALVVYALLVYPLIGTVAGHHVYPAAPTFGLPCPTTIFTLGLFLWADARLPLRLLVIPALWSVVGFSAAVSLSITEDYGLLVAGLVGTLMVSWRVRHSASTSTPVRTTPA